MEDLLRVNPYWKMACKRMEINYPNDRWEWYIVRDEEGKKDKDSHRYITFTVHSAKKVEWLFDLKTTEEEGKCCFYDWKQVAFWNERDGADKGKLNYEKWKHTKHHL